MPEPNTETIASMRVAVSLPFVRGCGQCRALAEGAAVAAIRDPSVTSFALQPGKIHAHVVVAGEPQRALEATDVPESSASLFAPLEMPHSDTNGFDPNMC